MSAREFQVQALVEPLEDFLATDDVWRDGAYVEVYACLLANHPCASKEDLQVIVKYWTKRTKVWKEMTGLDLFSLGEVEWRILNESFGEMGQHESFVISRNSNLSEVIDHPNAHFSVFNLILDFDFRRLHLAIAYSSKAGQKNLEYLSLSDYVDVRRMVARHERVHKLGPAYRLLMSEDEDPEVRKSLKNNFRFSIPKVKPKRTVCRRPVRHGLNKFLRVCENPMLL